MGNEFVPTKSKCATGNDSSDYLRDVVIHQGLRLVSTKVAAIQLWPTPTRVKEVWQELSMRHRTKLGVNSIDHLEMDNQIEALNRCWKVYLRCFTSIQSFKALYGRDSLVLMRYELVSTKDSEVGRPLKNCNRIFWEVKVSQGFVSLPLVVLADIIIKYENQYQHVAEAKYDYLVLIIDSITGSFEAGISKVGQTRKHVLLAFGIGVKQMIYCCNKMDATILNYSKASFEALYSDNIWKNVVVEDLNRGIITSNSKDDPLPTSLLKSLLNKRSSKELEKEPKFLKNDEAGMVKIIPTKHMLVKTFSKHPPLGHFTVKDMRQIATVGGIKRYEKKLPTSAKVTKLAVKKKFYITFCGINFSILYVGERYVPNLEEKVLFKVRVML
ncbi:hypothetical protein GQ457_07G021790 [Hibiscus cannabinus]